MLCKVAPSRWPRKALPRAAAVSPQAPLQHQTNNLFHPAAMNSDRPTVLVLSSDPAFARQVTASWADGPESPEFVLMKEDLCAELRHDSYDLAIAEGSPDSARITEVLAAGGKPAIIVHSDSFISRCSTKGPLLLLHRAHTWAALVGVLGR